MKKNNKGIVLVFVLVFTMAISTLVIFFHGKARDYSEVFAGTQQALLLENAAETGIEIGKAIIKADKKTFGIMTEGSPALIKKKYELGDVHLYLTIADENAKINPNKIFGDEKGAVNTLLAETFNRLFIVMGYPVTLPASVIDWIDEDDLQRPGGAESFYYRTAGLSYTPPNRNLYTAEEILMVRDFTEEIVFGDAEKEVKGLINFVTSFSDGKINVNTCEPEVLNALGFTAENVEKIAAERARRPVEEKFLTNVNKEVFLKNRSIIVFKSSYFLIEATAVDGKGMQKQVRGYIKRKDKEINTVRMELR